MDKVKLGKSPGQDEITPECTGEASQKEFCGILNDILKEKEISKDCNIYIILPLFKKRSHKNLFKL